MKEYWLLGVFFCCFLGALNGQPLAEKQKIAFVIDDFFFEPEAVYSDWEYALRLAHFVQKAAADSIPLHFFFGHTKRDYVANSLYPFLQQPQNTIGRYIHSASDISVRHRYVTQPDQFNEEFVPITFSIAPNASVLQTFRKLQHLGDSTTMANLVEQHAEELSEQFISNTARLQQTVGAAFPQVMACSMDELMLEVLPLLWKKLQRKGWMSLQLSELLQAHVFKHLPKEAHKDVLSKGNLPAYAAATLSDFWRPSLWLDWQIELILHSLTTEEMAGQLFLAAAGVYGQPDKILEKWIEAQQLGGVILLKGSKKEFVKRVARFDSLARLHNGIPLLYSADAEPSLLNNKISGLPKVPRTNSLKTIEAVDSIAAIISSSLKEIGIHQNYAPVADLSPNNEAIGNRTFGEDTLAVAELAGQFVKTTQAMGIVATAKHFPGHGYVTGDSHAMLPIISGELKEISVYQPLIDSGLLSIMVGHLAIEDNSAYDTKGLPASCSRAVVTDLLKEKMGFKGIVVTDAMRMGGVRNVPNAALEAVKAGCDMILMEPDVPTAVQSVVEAMRTDVSFRAQVEESVRKIIRLKLCLQRLPLAPLTGYP